jgi:hypothetical protein
MYLPVIGILEKYKREYSQNKLSLNAMFAAKLTNFNVHHKSYKRIEREYITNLVFYVMNIM